MKVKDEHAIAIVNSLVADQRSGPEHDIDVSTIATPAHKYICAVGDWCEGDGTYIRPISRNDYLLQRLGYKGFSKKFDGGGYTYLVMGASATSVIEIQSIISYPDRNGHGTAVMRRLCEVADELGVVLWLDARPYGKQRVHISLTKLIHFYRSFGFFPVKRINLAWASCGHRANRSLAIPMMRQPQERDDGARRG